MTSIFRRFPDFYAIVSVYAVIAVPAFGWTTVVWFWKLPYWIKFLTPGEIGAIFWYAMATAFFESMTVIGFLLLFSFVLPARILRDRFGTRGTWLALGLALSFLGHGVWLALQGRSFIQDSLVLWSLVSLPVIFLLAFASTRVHFLTWIAEWLSDRLIVFLYILLPLSILSVLIVVVRNIF